MLVIAGKLLITLRFVSFSQPIQHRVQMVSVLKPINHFHLSLFNHSSQELCFPVLFGVISALNPLALCFTYVGLLYVCVLMFKQLRFFSASGSTGSHNKP